MKKIIIFFVILLFNSAFAFSNIKVEALEDFNSILPVPDFRVKIVQDGNINNLFFIQGDILHCTLEKVKAPKRAKIDAKVFFKINSYEDSKGSHKIEIPLIAKYASRIVSKEEIKKIPPKNIIKKVGGTIGDFFVTGVSYGVSFVDGLITNNEENRLKSGVKQVYDDSFVSLIEYGDEILIKKGDVFYFVVKEEKENITTKAAAKLKLK